MATLHYPYKFFRMVLTDIATAQFLVSLRHEDLKEYDLENKTGVNTDHPWLLVLRLQHIKKPPHFCGSFIINLSAPQAERFQVVLKCRLKVAGKTYSTDKFYVVAVIVC